MKIVIGGAEKCIVRFEKGSEYLEPHFIIKEGSGRICVFELTADKGFYNNVKSQKPTTGVKNPLGLLLFEDSDWVIDADQGPIGRALADIYPIIFMYVRSGVPLEEAYTECLKLCEKLALA